MSILHIRRSAGCQMSNGLLPFVCLALFLLASTGRPVVGQAVDLRWRFEPNQSLSFQLRQTTTLESEFDLVKQKVESNSQMTCRWTVVSVDNDGTADVDLTFERIALDLSLPAPQGGTRTQVDTADTATVESATKGKEVERAILANLRAVLGQPIRIQVTPRGAIRGIRLSEAMKTAVREAPQAMQLKALLSEDGLQNLLGQAVPLLPEQPVEPGASWSAPSEVVYASSRFQRDQALTYVGRQEWEGAPADRVDFTATLKPVAAETTESAPAGIRVVAQATTGGIWFDSAAGRLRAATAETKLETDTPYRDKFVRVRLSSQTRITVDP